MYFSHFVLFHFKFDPFYYAIKIRVIKLFSFVNVLKEFVIHTVHYLGKQLKTTQENTQFKIYNIYNVHIFFNIRIV